MNKENKGRNVTDIAKRQTATHLVICEEVTSEALSGITQNGKEQQNLINMVFNQVAETYFAKGNLQEVADNILSHIKNIKPQDHIELMLVTQMIAVHNAAMKNFQLSVRRSVSSQFKTLELGNANLNLANKLVRTFNMQMEALNRYRGKGQQKMIIEHVNISNGGQAVIGNLTSNKKVEA